MRTFTYVEHIDRSPEAVFAFMMDFSQASRWRNLVRRIEFVDGGPPREGAQVRVTFDLQGRTRDVISTMWAYAPPRRVGYRNTESGITGTFEYTLEPRDRGTMVTFSADVRPHGLMWIVFPFLLRQHRARYRDQLANLKRAIEGPSPSS
jgi:polyketide cyclase/dehydrase/lipid transport protein